MDSTLPGTPAAYLVRSGEGARYALGAAMATMIARVEDTGGLLEAAVVSGSRGAASPPHAHTRGHEAILVTEGVLDVTVGDRRYAMAPGDYASIPPGVPHGYTMRGHYTRFVQWMIGGALGKFYAAVGTRTTEPGPDESAPQTFALPADGRHDEIDTTSAHGSAAGGPSARYDPLPDGPAPYVLESGDGERLLAGDQLFAFLSRQVNTGGRFIVLTTAGPAGARIPNHFHERHTETFFCLNGQMTMWADGRELALHAGDFLHVPARTVHSYRLDSAYTRFVGVLAPGLFEPFFRAMCEPYAGYAVPSVPGPVRFDRVMQRLHELDLKLVDQPARPEAP